MAPIFVMAIITTVVAAAAWYAIFRFMAGPHRRLAWLMVLTFPLSFAANAWVKRPLVLGVVRTTGVGPLAEAPLWFAAFILLVSPLTEEAIKVLPLLARRLRGALGERGAALWAGMALGAGFGFSEIWYLAWSFARSPAFAGYPFWAYTGFLNERLAVTYVHAVMTAVLVTGLAGGRAWLGYLAAVGLHTLVNLGAVLGKMGHLNETLAFLWLGVPLVVLTIVFVRLYRDSLAQAPPPETVVFRRKPS